MNKPFYEVTASNQDGDSKLVSVNRYKSDALKVAQRFLNVDVTRKGPATTKTVYSHTTLVASDASDLFEKASV